jgi:hypothetical protein
MNYAFSEPDGFSKGFWTLDYSRELLSNPK